MNKTQIKDYVNRLVGRYETEVDLSAEDFDFMLTLLLSHENSTEKIGPGVKRMWLQSTRYGNKCFWLERLDGTKTDFSYYKCLTASNDHSDYLKACRKAIEPLVIGVRDSVFGDRDKICCPILGIQITRHESHVDHYPHQFIDLAKEFFISQNKKIEVDHGDGRIGVIFKDKDMEKSWVEFHEKHASLRVISEKANLQLKKGKW